MLPHWVRDYIGLPFAFCGRDRRGLDCYGLVRLVHAEVLNANLPDYMGRYEDHRRETYSGLFAEGSSGGPWVRRETPSMFDVILLNLSGMPAHCGIVVGGSQMLHITEQTASCVERFDGPMWANRVEGFYRYRRPTNE